MSQLEFFEHENIVRLIDILKPPHETDYKDIYIVTEKMEADLNKLSSLQLVGRLTPFGADEPSARLVVIAQKPCYHRFELRYEHVVETTLCDGQRACILRAKLPDGRPQMRWLDAAQVEAIHQSVHHLFHFYQANVQQGENVRYAGTTQRHQQNCHRIVYRYPDGKQTIRWLWR